PFLLCLVTVWLCGVTLNPAAWSWLVAWDTVSPLTPGTLTVVGAWATVSVTVDPLGCCVFPDGLCEMTVPDCALLDVCFTVLTLKPSPVSVPLAVATSSPVTSGRLTSGLPEETNSVIDVPTGCVCPAGGSVRVASPVGMAPEDSLWIAPTFSPARLIFLTASDLLRPTTDGIDALPGPLETLSVTVEPASALVPPSGSCPITVPDGLLFETWMGVATLKPAF